ncbi:MAG: lamin tail domain-containing protein [Polyangiales bacterium]
MAQPGSFPARLVTAALLNGLLPLLSTCAGPVADEPALIITEVMTSNDAAWVDEAGQVDDWVEVTNPSDRPLALGHYHLRDQRGRDYPFPATTLAPGQALVIFADGDPAQGPLHADFKLSAEGVTLTLVDSTEQVVDRVEVPALAANESFARFPHITGDFTRCRYASPERDNGLSCGPPARPEPSDRTWPAFPWPATPAEVWPASPSPLALVELALKPAQHISVQNVSGQALDLSRYQLRLAATKPARALPDASQGQALVWPATQLAPGEQLLVPVTTADLGEIAGDPLFEGVVGVFADGTALERVDFMHWPDGASLVRTDPRALRFHFCVAPLRDGTCTPLASRDVGDRIRHLYTPGDYAALAAGETHLAMHGVKFVVDLAGGGVHLLSNRSYPLHYEFVREQIFAEPALDRCDPSQNAAFTAGWYAFSDTEYFQVDGRRFLLGTLDTYTASGMRAVDYAIGDVITGEQMRQAYFAVLPHMDAEDPSTWSVHPSEPRQEQALESVAGQVPIVGLNAPFRGLRYQSLTLGVAYGRLEFLPASELEAAVLGPDRIVVTDAVPNDIPFVGGLITEVFQTPLAHVNVLSQNRGTPNMSLLDARHDPVLAPLLGQLVRFEVDHTGFHVQPASAEEARAFQAEHYAAPERVSPRLDVSVRGPVDLAGRGLSDLPSIGAKAAQLAELSKVVGSGACPGPLALPATPFAIPLVHYVEHFAQSGALAQLTAAEQNAEFRADANARARVLADIQAKMLATPVDPALLTQVEALISERFGDVRLRFRSSSNTEDLPGFNGAGLYESWSGALGDPERPIERAIREVWASLWSLRAYDEREYGAIDQHGVAMGVLVHPAFLSERANVIAISRNVLDPTRSDVYYMSAQTGEAAVANPAPGVTTEELLHHWRMIPGAPEVEYQSTSSLTRGARVLSVSDVQRISCRVTAIHDHFRALIDPSGQDRWFAMDMEIKLVGDARDVIVKQARPYSFSQRDRPSDCREF